MPSNRGRGTERLLLPKPPGQWIRSSEFPGSNPGISAWNPFPGQTSIPVLALPLASTLSGPEAEKHPSLCLEKPTAPLRNHSHQVLE